jgi:hypothetical protein
MPAPLNVKKIVKIASLSIFFILLVGYALFVSKDLLFGVKIKNVNLTDGATYTESVIKVTGNAKNAIKLTLNGREISINQAGDFNETIALLSGYNIINLRAEDKFGLVDEENYKLILLNK